MKKKNKNKARKSITAVGAVVAAGLTPGIATGSPVPQPPHTDVELTAADVISINGDVFDFDELFAMNQVNRDRERMKVVYGPPQPKVYGPVPPNKDKDKKKDKDKDQQIREQEIADSIAQEQLIQAEKYRLEQERKKIRERDSIDRIIFEQHRLVYGPPRPTYTSLIPEQVRHQISTYSKDKAITFVEDKIMDYIFYIIGMRSRFGDENNIIRSDTELAPEIMTALIDEVECSFGVQLTEEAAKQLGTPNRLARFIVEVIKPIKK